MTGISITDLISFQTEVVETTDVHNPQEFREQARVWAIENGINLADLEDTLEAHSYTMNPIHGGVIPDLTA